MRFQALPVLATMLAIPNLAFGAPKCLDGNGVWRSEAARSAAAHGIDKWCNNIAPSKFAGKQEVHECLEVDYEPINVNLWMFNTNDGDAILTIDNCKKLLKKIVDSCSSGGSDTTLAGWGPTAYPANHCYA
ncbi:hypothetical protein ABOM_002502 [Aspergillus bombycis]|uniref:Glycan binding protein Y3-like domain-containing protein n=1 Tax=Aspergillus bombycis TaxID=109264 RepID=A0A1F8A9V2_9EURO|nr:hypothetical protein ABOM_002502 [Aspergillus bombycis]OGM48526.1 hypothetical protein ABOM_002502 [Aspergillus bombycis]